MFMEETFKNRQDDKGQTHPHHLHYQYLESIYVNLKEVKYNYKR